MAEKEVFVWHKGDNVDEEVWDDQALIDAYDRAVKSVRNRSSNLKNGEIKKKTGNYSFPEEKNSSDKKCWKEGDYCTAPYSDDSKYYEAKILEIDSSYMFCVVSFIGYGDEEELQITSLKPSGGSKSRKRQIKNAKRDQKAETQSESTSTFQTSETSSADGEPEQSNSVNKHKTKSQSHSKTSSKISFHSPVGPTFCQHPLNVPQFPLNGCVNGSCSSKKLPFIPPPPPFPMGDGHDNENDALSSLLMSWYMSGYYMGYYIGKKEDQCHICHSTN